MALLYGRTGQPKTAVFGPAVAMKGSVKGAVKTTRGATTVASLGQVKLPGGGQVGLGRIVALYYRASALYQNHEHIRCLFF
jgi:hypothetical protein